MDENKFHFSIVVKPLGFQAPNHVCGHMLHLQLIMHLIAS